MLRLGWLSLAILTAVSALGCRAGRHHAITPGEAFCVGDLPRAQAMLEELTDDDASDRYNAELDLAIVELASGKPHAAESRLRSLRDHFDAQPKIQAVQDAASMATDDNVRPFRLTDYEQVLLRSMLAVCSLAADRGDATAYCLQAQAKQAELSKDTGQDTASTTRVALAPYLHGTLREATHHDYDDAERAFQLVSSIRPDFQPSADDIARARGGVHSAAGHGVLQTIAWVGPGPRKVEVVAPTTTASLQIASSLLRAIRNHNEDAGDELVLPNVASVTVPAIEVPASRIDALAISSGSAALGVTQTITDVGRLAAEHCEAEMPHTIARAVVRRVLKETTVSTVSDSLGLGGNAAAVAEFAAINLWSATEKADLRCWSLLPREFQVLRTELPAGNHTITLHSIDAAGNRIAPPLTRDVQISDGRTHYLFVFAPESIVAAVP